MAEPTGTSFDGAWDGPAVTLIGADAGPAKELTDEVVRALDQRRIPFRRVSPARLADVSMPVPSVIARYGDRDVTYRGYNRILSEFLPRVTAS